MARRQHYSDDARAAALAVLDANGGNLSRSAREAGVPPSTLDRWRSDRSKVGSPELRDQKRMEAADVYRSIESKAGGLLDRALDLIAPATVATDPRYLTALNTVAGTATDKRQVLTGLPTERVEHTTLTPDEAIAAARQLRVLEGGKRKVSA